MAGEAKWVPQDQSKPQQQHWKLPVAGVGGGVDDAEAGGANTKSKARREKKQREQQKRQRKYSKAKKRAAAAAASASESLQESSNYNPHQEKSSEQHHNNNNDASSSLTMTERLPRDETQEFSMPPRTEQLWPAAEGARWTRPGAYPAPGIGRRDDSSDSSSGQDDDNNENWMDTTNGQQQQQQDPMVLSAQMISESMLPSPSEEKSNKKQFCWGRNRLIVVMIGVVIVIVVVVAVVVAGNGSGSSDAGGTTTPLSETGGGGGGSGPPSMPTAAPVLGPTRFPTTQAPTRPLNIHDEQRLALFVVQYGYARNDPDEEGGAGNCQNDEEEHTHYNELSLRCYTDNRGDPPIIDVLDPSDVGVTCRRQTRNTMKCFGGGGVPEEQLFPPLTVACGYSDLDTTSLSHLQARVGFQARLSPREPVMTTCGRQEGPPASNNSNNTYYVATGTVSVAIGQVCLSEDGKNELMITQQHDLFCPEAPGILDLPLTPDNNNNSSTAAAAATGNHQIQVCARTASCSTNNNNNTHDDDDNDSTSPQQQQQQQCVLETPFAEAAFDGTELYETRTACDDFTNKSTANGEFVWNQTEMDAIVERDFLIADFAARVYSQATNNTAYNSSSSPPPS